MKYTGIINQPISSVISALGHTDMVAVADAGLPIPDGPVRIDLALKKGIPCFIETVQVVMSEMYVEKALIAAEMQQVSPALHDVLLKNLVLHPKPMIDYLPHEEFKKLLPLTRAIIRTGEYTPFANVILVAGVWGFDR